MTKKFEELNVLDDFLINAIASDPEVGEPFCRTVLSVLLQRKIEKLKIVAQKSIPAFAPGLRGIRMDVEIQEELPNASVDEPEMNIYDMEPHLRKDMNFPKHNRFYQAKIDGRLMRSGETNFDKMPNLYVITLTNFDIFGKDYMMYTFRNMCEEVPELKYDDGLRFIYFYTGGTKGGTPEIEAMLRYLEKSSTECITNDATKEVHNYVERVKVIPEVKETYMKFEEIMAYREEIGLAKGETSAKRQAVLDVLGIYGCVSDELRKRIEEENDIQKLNEWLVTAVKAGSVEGFSKSILGD